MSSTSSPSSEQIKEKVVEDKSTMSSSSSSSATTTTSSSSNVQVGNVTQEKEKEKEKEDLVGKYKRLLAMARNSLEANQVSLQEKDNHIKKLKKLLEEEVMKAKQQQRALLAEDDNDNVPRSILRQVDVDDTIHVLVEYTGSAKDRWFQFGSEVELMDWIQSLSGVPLTLPQKCLTVEESAQIVAESKKTVDRVVEEFRRYKVRAEIARKQKDSEQKHTSNSSPAPPLSFMSVENMMNEGTRGYFTSSPGDVTSNDGTAGHISAEIQSRIDKETKRWKLAYESVVKENEQLRNRGGESVVATQWRERYEICRVEKEELMEKLKILGSNGNGVQSTTISTSTEQGKTFQQLYVELKEEYKEFRSRVLALEKERERKRELRRNGGNTEEKEKGRSQNGSSRVQPYSGSNAASRHEYIRNLILQYLCCKDPIVRSHMENAIIQMFRFNEDEKNAIEERKKNEENYEDALLASITNFVSNTFYNSS